MPRDFIETAKEEIHSFLKNNFKKIKFTVKYSGEFFIAAANVDLPSAVCPCSLKAASGCEIKGSTIVFPLSDEWLKYAMTNIGQAECTESNLSVYSQIKRLEKQLEFGLCGGKWDERMYSLAKKILYFMHTKSLSIRQNIVKKCAREYNVIQRQGRIPKELTVGYRNALCQISGRM